LGGWQTVPAVHETHEPVLHTRFCPHEVPSLSDVPVSVQVGVPDAHASVPLRHGFDGVQLVPALHAMQLPLEQTWFEPHTAPSG
jgi:hypothetical protein